MTNNYAFSLPNLNDLTAEQRESIELVNEYARICSEKAMTVIENAIRDTMLCHFGLTTDEEILAFGAKHHCCWIRPPQLMDHTWEQLFIDGKIYGEYSMYWESNRFTVNWTPINPPEELETENVE